MAAHDPIAIEVAYALPDEQIVIALTVPRGTTAREAVELSGLSGRYPGISARACAIGIYGRVVAGDTPLRAGDRVEIYRALLADPKQARRRRARRGR
jgi:putative ubiquitin-RnfH superfamily antitoxin RatB of RatAB toxin-antitoxin module